MPLVQKLKDAGRWVWNQKKKVAVAAGLTFVGSVVYNGFPETMEHIWMATSESVKFGARIFLYGAKRYDEYSYVKYETENETVWLKVPPDYSRRIEELANKYPDSSKVIKAFREADAADGSVDGVASALNIENILLPKINTEIQKKGKATIYRYKPE